MNGSKDDTGDIDHLIDNVVEKTLPRLIDIKKKVAMGGEFSKADILFMSQVTRYAQRHKQLISQFPEWQNLYNEAFDLYLEVIDKALDNAENKSREQ
jgi:hypothetical protein